jgi:hypothetical protein
VPIVGPSLTFLELAPKPIPDVTLMLSDRFRFIARAFHTSLVSARAIGTDRTIVTTMSVAFINSILPQRDEIRQAARLKVLTQRQSSSIVCRWRLRRFILHSSASSIPLGEKLPTLRGIVRSMLTAPVTYCVALFHGNPRTSYSSLSPPLRKSHDVYGEEFNFGLVGWRTLELDLIAAHVIGSLFDRVGRYDNNYLMEKED